MTDAIELFAGEHVLGVLTTEERARILSLIASDQAYARAVRRWERQLGELHALVEAVEPPPDLWERIKAVTIGVAEGEALVQSSAADINRRAGRRLARWRGAAAGFALLAAILAGLLGITLRAPQLLPPILHPEAPLAKITGASSPPSPAAASPSRPPSDP